MKAKERNAEKRKEEMNEWIEEKERRRGGRKEGNADC